MGKEWSPKVLKNKKPLFFIGSNIMLFDQKTYFLRKHFQFEFF